MKRLWKDPVWSSVIATLIGALLLWFGNHIYQWVNIIKLYDSVVSFLFKETYQPNWVLVILYLCTFTVFLGLLVAAREIFFPKEGIILNWKAYKEDDFFNIKWRWEYRGNRLDNLNSFCPYCDYQVFPKYDYDDSDHYFSSKILVFDCDSCNNRMGPFKFNHQELESRVERFIQQKLRNETWNK